MNSSNKTWLIRWIVLDAINHGRPYPIAETLILAVIRKTPIQCSALELRLNIEYLDKFGLVKLERLESAPWTAQLTSSGVDIFDYTVSADLDIARPGEERPRATTTALATQL